MKGYLGCISAKSSGKIVQALWLVTDPHGGYVRLNTKLSCVGLKYIGAKAPESEESLKVALEGLADYCTENG